MSVRTYRKPNGWNSWAVTLLLLFAAMQFASSAHAETYRLPLFVDETTSGQMGVLRIHNESEVSGTVSIYAIDDSGTRSGPSNLTLRAAAAVEIDADNLESGDVANGLSGGVGTISGDVRLEMSTDLSISALAYLRTSDGTLAVLHDEVRARATVAGLYEYRVPVFNPASNMAQASSLRLINSSGSAAMVSITGRDDSGTVAASGSLSLMLSAGGARSVTAQQLEGGGAGLTGLLGAGMGNWRLVVTSDQPVEVVNLVTSSTGRLDNLSSTGRDGLEPTHHGVFSERFTGEVIATRSETQSGRLAIQTGDAFSETVETSVQTTSTRSGNYSYRRVNTNAGELILNYDQGDPCITNLQFSSRTHGWYASRCGQGDDLQATWRGGSWALVEEDAPPATDIGPPRFPSGAGPGEQNYTLNEAIVTVVLPAASGGTGPLNYSLMPSVPGLTFDSATRQLAGAPSQVGIYSMIYSVTDDLGDSDILRFSIVVREGESTDCLLGLQLRQGESCTYPGTSSAFTVNADGSASFLIVNSTRAINLPNRTYQGQLYDFRAEHLGEGVWRIDRLQGEQAPALNSTPRFSDPDALGNQTYTVGTAITDLALPSATRGDGTLSYSLSPSVQGLTFDPATRRLTGTPTEVGSFAMTYMVRDQDGDADSLSFSITVEDRAGQPDLQVVLSEVNDADLAASGSFQLVVLVSNEGDGTASKTTLRWYRSTDVMITASDIQMDTNQVVSLSPASFKVESISLTPPSRDGAYYYACVDATEDESDSTNNCSLPVKVGGPDLRTGVYSGDIIVRVGEKHIVNIDVHNDGNSASGATTLRYYRSSDDTISTADTLVGTDHVRSLEPSEYTGEYILLTVPQNLEQGTYYFGGCIDAVPDESDSTNNCSGALGVAVLEAGRPIENRPDLEVGTPTVTDDAPLPGGSFTLSATVSNTGHVSSNATTLRWYRSTDATITMLDTLEGTDTVGRLAAFEVSANSVTLIAPLVAGPYYYGACVDSVFGESDSGNNCSAPVEVTVVQTER